MLKILEYKVSSFKILHKEVLPFEKSIQPRSYQWTLDCVPIPNASASGLGSDKSQTSLQLLLSC